MTIHPTSQEQISAVQAMERALTTLELAFGDSFPDVVDRLVATAKDRHFRTQDGRDLSEMLKAAP
ncbi:MAG: hypothetical protein AB7R90_07135 [Reyranellaceae bacterium]